MSNPSSLPSISFIVTTVGTTRLSDLLRLLQSIPPAHADSFEVILVFQSADGAVPSEIDAAIGAWKHGRLIVSPPCSASHARNLGLRYATGDIVGFPDDDCWYPPQTIEGVLVRFASSAIDCLCVCLVDPESGQAIGRRPRARELAVTFWNFMKIPIEPTTFARRSVVGAGGAIFDERFGPGNRWGAGEGASFMHALLAAGKRIHYDGNLAVYHPATQPVAAEARKAYRYGVGTGALVSTLLRACTFAHIPFFFEVLFRAAGGALLSALCGRWQWALFYGKRFAGLVVGAFEGASAFLTE